MKIWTHHWKARVLTTASFRLPTLYIFSSCGGSHKFLISQAARKERRFKAIHGSSKAAEKIVKNYLKAKALETVTGRKR